MKKLIRKIRSIQQFPVILWQPSISGRGFQFGPLEIDLIKPSWWRVLKTPIRFRWWSMEHWAYTDDQDLKPCPFCGSTQADGPIIMNCDISHELGGVCAWYVDCIECGASGGSTSDEQSAAAEWNRRSGK